MNLPDLIHSNPARFSTTSCMTEDSVDSAGATTPLDTSPPPPPSNLFTLINIVNDDPLPNSIAYPAVASTYAVGRRRAQTSPRPVPASIIMTVTSIPQEQSIVVYDNNSKRESRTTSSSKKSSSRLWPKFKRMISSANNNNTDKMKQLFESMHLSAPNNEDVKSKPQEQKSSSNYKRWLGRNRTRVGPQR